MDSYAVMGRPVLHSRSPFLFAQFAAQTRQALTYEALEVAPHDLAQALTHFEQQGGKGVNITLPLKELAYTLVDQASSRAVSAAALNVISFRADGTRYGDNLDGDALVHDITHYHRFPLKNQRILVLGAGGAVRGALLPLLEQQPKEVVIVNRTPLKAEKLAATFAVSAATWDELIGRQFDVVINGTSASLLNQALPLPDQLLSAHACCYDMVYAKGETAFLHWAKRNGALLTCDGSGMLIEQAAESFLLWRGHRPDTRSIRLYFKTF